MGEGLGCTPRRSWVVKTRTTRSGEKVTSRIRVHVPWHFSTSYLQLRLSRCSRGGGGSFTSSHVYTRTHIHNTGNKRVWGENSIDVFSMRLKINLSPRARALSSLALGLRRDATRRDALLSRMETNYVFHVEERFSSLEASIDGGGGRGGRRLVNTGSPSTRGNLFATDSSIDRAEFGWAARGRPLNRRFVTDPFCRSDDKQTGTRRPLTRRIHNRNIHVRFECVYVISDDRDFVGTRRFAFSS